MISCLKGVQNVPKFVTTGYPGTPGFCFMSANLQHWIPSKPNPSTRLIVSHLRQKLVQHLLSVPTLTAPLLLCTGPAVRPLTAARPLINNVGPSPTGRRRICYFLLLFSSSSSPGLLQLSVGTVPDYLWLSGRLCSVGPRFGISDASSRCQSRPHWQYCFRNHHPRSSLPLAPNAWLEEQLPELHASWHVQDQSKA